MECNNPLLVILTSYGLKGTEDLNTVLDQLTFKDAVYTLWHFMHLLMCRDCCTIIQVVHLVDAGVDIWRNYHPTMATRKF